MVTHHRDRTDGARVATTLARNPGSAVAGILLMAIS